MPSVYVIAKKPFGDKPIGTVKKGEKFTCPSHLALDYFEQGLVEYANKKDEPIKADEGTLEEFKIENYLPKETADKIKVEAKKKAKK